MIKTIKINNMINNSFNLNNYDVFNSDEADKLFNEWNIYIDKNGDKIMSYLCVDINDIKKEELQQFFNIYTQIILNENNEFTSFFIDKILDKFSKKNKYSYKIDINNYVNEFLTMKIKTIYPNLYFKYIGNNKNISNILILILLNELYFEDEADIYFNIIVLFFKKYYTDADNLKIIYNYIRQKK